MSRDHVPTAAARGLNVVKDRVLSRDSPRPAVARVPISELHEHGHVGVEGHASAAGSIGMPAAAAARWNGSGSGLDMRNSCRASSSGKPASFEGNSTGCEFVDDKWQFKSSTLPSLVASRFNSSAYEVGSPYEKARR